MLGRGFLALLLFFPYVLYADEFVIRDIQLKGLQRISEGSVFADLPIAVGDRVDESQSASWINALYQIGYFEDIVISRQGGVLTFTVRERPGIAGITLVGNKGISDEQLTEVLEQAGVAIGEIYDLRLLQRLTEGLTEQYHALGKFNARINADVKKLRNNRVNIEVAVDEGKVSKIKEFKLVGNLKIKDKELFKDIESGTSRWYEFWNDKDSYSRVKLAGDIEAIRTVYYNRGYLDFEVKNTRVSLSPDKRNIYVKMTIEEGEQYRIKDISLSCRLAVNRNNLKKSITLQKGKIFSRSEAIVSSQAIELQLKNIGYANAKVSAIPTTNPEDNTIDIAFLVESGSKTYVRRINFRGNHETSDEVFRREMRQIEGAEYSANKIELSRRRLQRLPYIGLVDINSRAVEGEDDQVDIDIDLLETRSGSFSLGAGYSDAEGAVLSLGLNQDNFLGTGNRVGFAFNNSSVDTNYTLSFTDPFYTIDSISRSWSVSYRSVDNSEQDISDTEFDEARVHLGYGIPLSENDTLNIGATLQDIQVVPGSGIGSRLRDYYVDQCGSTRVRQGIRVLINPHNCDFLNLILTAGLDYDTRDRALFPTDGTKIRGSLQLFVPIDGLAYYKADYFHRHYIPFDDNADYVFAGKARVSYAKEYGKTIGVPPYDRFFAGGASSLRGYLNNSLGPRDDNDDPLGGEFRVLFGGDLFFPTDFLYDRQRLRMSAFVDYGNVFKDVGQFSLSDMKGAYGMQVNWLTAVGAISFNFASHFKDESNDDIESFQFNLGSSF